MTFRVAPRWVRRPVAVLALLVALVLVALLLPLLVVAAAIASAFMQGRWRAMRLLAFALVCLLAECVGLVVALVLWLASGFGWKLHAPAFERAHYAVLRVLLDRIVRSARVLFHLEIVQDGAGWSPLDDGVPGSENAMLVLARHAGPGDSLLLVSTLLDRDHLRRPRIVLKDTLQLDPLLDVYLNRLPTAFLSSGRAGLAERIGALATGLGDQDAVLIFPEGGNFTAHRRTRAIDRLRGKGMVEQADRAEQLQHVLPPRTAGVAAALAAAPRADVVFVAHTGLEHLSSAADIWNGLPMDTVVRMRWDFVPAAEVPRDRGAQEDWLFDHWAQIDQWIAAQARD